MIATLLFLLQREYRDRYPSAWAFFGEGFGLLASLAIYWYTAKAFAPTFASGHAGYFHYLIIGETALFVPLSLFQGLSRAFRQAVATGTLDAMLVQPISPLRVIVLLGSALVPLELSRILLTFVVAQIGFGFQISLPALAGFFLLQLLAIPAFLGLGMIAVSALLLFGRGDSFLSYLGAGAAILAGAYFPVTVLPEAVQTLSLNLSPFSTLLSGTRALIEAGSWNHSLLVTASELLAWSFSAFAMGSALLHFAFRAARRTGTPLIFSS